MNTGFILAGLAGAGYLLAKGNSASKEAEKQADEKYQKVIDELAERLEGIENRNEQKDLEEQLDKQANDLTKQIYCKAFAGAVAGYYDNINNTKTTYTWCLYLVNNSPYDVNIRIKWCNVRLFGQLQIDGYEINKVFSVKANTEGWFEVAHGYEKPIYETNAIKNNIKAKTGKAYDVVSDDVEAVVTFEVTGATAGITAFEKTVSVYGACQFYHYSSKLDKNIPNNLKYQPLADKELLDEALDMTNYTPDPTVDQKTIQQKAEELGMTVQEYTEYKRSKLK